jgi:antitoxin MazE
MTGWRCHSEPQAKNLKTPLNAVDGLDKYLPRVYLQCRYCEWRLDMRTRVQKWGNSLALRIPKSFAAEVGLQKEASVEISLADGKLVITPVAEPKLTLKQLLARVTKGNLHHEVDTGPAVGKETW